MKARLIGAAVGCALFAAPAAEAAASCAFVLGNLCTGPPNCAIMRAVETGQQTTEHPGDGLHSIG